MQTNNNDTKNRANGSVAGSQSAFPALTAEQTVLLQAKQQGLLPENATVDRYEAPSWVILVLSFLGAQLAVWPFLAFLFIELGDILESPTGCAILGLVFMAGGVVGLRRKDNSIFVDLLALNILLSGIGLWCVALFQFELESWTLPACAFSVAVLAFLVRVGWVQSLLGMAFACIVLYINWNAILGFGAARNEYESGGAEYVAAGMSWVSAWALCAAWWLWCVLDPRLGGTNTWFKNHVQSTHAFTNGVVVGLLLVVLFQSTGRAWMWQAAGSADVQGAGMAQLFHINVYTVVACLVTIAAGVWLGRNWINQATTQHGSNKTVLTPQNALWLLLYALWAVLALVVPLLGVLAVVFSVALASSRKHTLGLALFVMLAQLSAFYYALQWPLAHKAGSLAVLGGVLGAALYGLHMWSKYVAEREQADVSEAQSRQSTMQKSALFVRAGLFASLVLALVLTQWDAGKKEHVLAQGQKIYIPLVPLDPRSLMQGDYMALNFDLPREIIKGTESLIDEENAEPVERKKSSALSPLQGTALVVASLDEKGIATLQRRYRSGEALAAHEVLIPLKYMKGDWVVVTDAYFFPEGQGRVFNKARYGEFRALGKGKVLLAGLADEKLQRIEPQPDRAQADEEDTDFSVTEEGVEAVEDASDAASAPEADAASSAASAASLPETGQDATTENK